MKLHEIIAQGPVVYAVKVADNELGEVYNVVGEKIYRYVYDAERGDYGKAGVKLVFVEYDGVNTEALVTQAEDWHTDILSSDEEVFNGRGNFGID